MNPNHVPFSTHPVMRFLVLARYDLLMQIRERGNLLLLAVVIITAWIGLWQGWQFYTTSQQTAAAASAQATKTRQAAQDYAHAFFAQQDDIFYRSARFYNNPADLRGYAFREHLAFAIKPAIAGAPLAIAQADVLPAYVRVRAESMDSVRNSNEIAHPGWLAAGRFDLLFVVLYLWPLALLAFNASALTQESESGRLRSLQLQQVSRLGLLMTQAGVRSLAATLLFICAIAIPALALGVLPLNAAGAMAMLQWLLVLLLYSLFWTGVAIAMSAQCSNRATALFAAFGAWVSLAILLPALLAAGVNWVTPAPAREAYLLEVRHATDRLNADQANMTARFYDQHPEWRPASDTNNRLSPDVMRLVRAAELEQALHAADANFAHAKAAQSRLFSQWTLLSPVTLAHTAFSQLSGNDSERHDQFLAAVRHHQLALRAYFLTRLQLAAQFENTTPCRHPTGTCLSGFGFTDHDQIPAFVAPSRFAMNSTFPWQMGGVLLMWLLALVMAAAYRLRKNPASVR